MTLTTMNGKQVLVFRLGNARGNEIVEASINVSVLRDEVSAEGHHVRRLHELKLQRQRTPVFTLTWVVFHDVDEDSALFGVDWSVPERTIDRFIITLIGHDGTYGQTTYARHNYFPEDVRIKERFVDVVDQLEDGRLMVDYQRFHDTEPDEQAESRFSAKTPSAELEASEEQV
jgi:inward rectifier potassium channel